MTDFTDYFPTRVLDAARDLCADTPAASESEYVRGIAELLIDLGGLLVTEGHPPLTMSEHRSELMAWLARGQEPETYNVAATFVGLVRADSPQEARRIFVQTVEHRADVAHHPDDPTEGPFVSEPLDADATAKVDEWMHRAANLGFTAHQDSR